MSSPVALLIGAGPAGLAAAACLKGAGIPLRWVDREGVVGGAYRRMYPKIILASPARYSSLPGLALSVQGEYVSAGGYLEYLEGYASHHGLHPEKACVEAVERLEGGFRVRFFGGAEGLFQAAVVATGIFDHPRRPQIPGLKAGEGAPELLHACAWPGPERFRGRRLLIIGGGVSGIEIAEECARAGFAVTVSARRGRVRTVPQRFLGLEVHDYAVVFERLPVRLFPRFCARHPAIPGTDLGFWRFLRQGLIRILPEVSRFEGKQAFFGDRREEFDAVIFATGYRYETPFLPPAVARAAAGHPLALDAESPSWPGLYFIGFPCSRGLDSEFLRGMARDAPAIARKVARLSPHKPAPCPNAPP